MNIKEIEKRLVELKGLQAAQFQVKKDKRDAAALQAVREEMNNLKKEARKVYKGK